jgi:hypothetical protein
MLRVLPQDDEPKPTKPAGAQAVNLRLPPELFEMLDRWRLQQVGPPSRNAAVRWVLEQFLRKL